MRAARTDFAELNAASANLFALMRDTIAINRKTVEETRQAIGSSLELMRRLDGGAFSLAERPS